MSERAILAAQGYMELGMAAEALAELASLPAITGGDPDIIELRLHILMQATRWAEALSTAEELIRLNADAIPAYIHGAFALHELGRTEEALNLLLKGPSDLRKDPTFHYNIGCYQAVLGNREAALESLHTSFALDESYREFASRDPDLTLVRESIKP